MPETNTAPYAGVYTWLPLAKLVPAPYNSRRALGDNLDELAASIKVDGVLEPLLVRIHPKHSGSWEIIAGHRRAAAAKAAGLEEVPAMVLDVDTKQARRICATENLQREDLHPLEEARAIQNLVDDAGAAAAADEIGKSLRYVARRANLLRLSKAWQKGIASKPHLAAFPAAVLDEIALLSEPDQDELFQRFEYDYNGVPSVAWIRDEVSGYLRSLKRATWKLDDAELVPKQGACVDCTRHSAASVGLFDDAVGDVSSATCLDSACWEEKLHAHAIRALEAARAEHGENLLLVAGGWEGTGHRRRTQKETKALGTPALRDWDYKPAKKNAKGAVPAFVVEGKGTGKVRWITVAKGARGSGAARAQGKAAAKVKPGSAEDLKAKRERLKRRRDGRLVDIVREWVAKLETSPHGPAELLGLVAAYGIAQRHYSFAQRSKAQAKDPLASVWVSVQARIVSAITRTSSGALASQVREAKWLLAELWPKEGAAMLRDAQATVATEIPKPKSLERLEKGGAAPGAPKKKAKRRPVAKKKAKRKARARPPA